METVINTLVGFLISFGVLTPSTDTPPPSIDDEVANIEYSVDENRFEELKLAIETINELGEELDETGEKLDLDGDGIIDVIEDDDTSDDDSDDTSDDDSDDDFEDELEDEMGLGSIFLADNLADRIRGWDNMSERAKQRLQELKELKALQLSEDEFDDVVDENIGDILEEIEDIDDVNDSFKNIIDEAKATVLKVASEQDQQAAKARVEALLEERENATQAVKFIYNLEDRLTGDLGSFTSEKRNDRLEEALEQVSDAVLENLTVDIAELIPEENRELLSVPVIEILESVIERASQARAQADARRQEVLTRLSDAGVDQNDIDDFFEDINERRDEELERIAEELEEFEDRFQESLERSEERREREEERREREEERREREEEREEERRDDDDDDE